MCRFRSGRSLFCALDAFNRSTACALGWPNRGKNGRDPMEAIALFLLTAWKENAIRIRDETDSLGESEATQVH